MSKDKKLVDDSIELDVLLKKEEAGSILTSLDVGKLITKENVVENEIFDTLRAKVELVKDDLLDQSVIIPEPELNIRFDDPFVDKRQWKLGKILKICEVDAVH